MHVISSPDWPWARCNHCVTSSAHDGEIPPCECPALIVLEAISYTANEHLASSLMGRLARCVGSWRLYEVDCVAYCSITRFGQTKRYLLDVGLQLKRAVGSLERSALDRSIQERPKQHGGLLVHDYH